VRRQEEMDDRLQRVMQEKLRQSTPRPPPARRPPSPHGFASGVVCPEAERVGGARARWQASRSGARRGPSWRRCAGGRKGRVRCRPPADPSTLSRTNRTQISPCSRKWTRISAVPRTNRTHTSLPARDDSTRARPHPREPFRSRPSALRAAAPARVRRPSPPPSPRKRGGARLGCVPRIAR